MRAFRIRTSRLLVGIAVSAVTAIVTAQTAARTDLSRADAKRLLEKTTSIAANAEADKPAARRTPLLEREVNAYLAFEAGEHIPEGLVDPTISMLGEGRLAGTAVVDLDVVRQARKRTFYDPLNFLRGRLPLSARGVLTTEAGKGRFSLETAEISGVPIPKTLLQELVSYYSRSPERPNGYGMEEPFELPARIREIEVGLGQAVIVQ
jgi:hypothetical protein